jgi:hypothetical protein
VSDTGATSPKVIECPDADPMNDACCTLDPSYCVVYECSSPCNTYTKTLHACGGEFWGSGTTLGSCQAASPQELEALDGKPCAGEPPCDITTGDLDTRFAICANGRWYVFGQPL